MAPDHQGTKDQGRYQRIVDQVKKKLLCGECEVWSVDDEDHRHGGDGRMIASSLQCKKASFGAKAVLGEVGNEGDTQGTVMRRASACEWEASKMGRGGKRA